MPTYHLYWTRADQQGDMAGGQYASVEEAEAAIPAWREELLSMCADDDQREAIEAGRFEVVEVLS